MIKKVKTSSSAKGRIFSDIIGGKRVIKVVKKARATTSKTTNQAKQTIKFVSGQVIGTERPRTEEFEAPRITTETVAENRQEVLTQARRFIYPLHSRRKVVLITSGIVAGVIGLIIGVTAFMLYGLKSTDSFVYNISRFIPYPVARVDGEFVRYEKYLFEVRNSIHYLRNYAQEGIDIDSAEGKELIKDTKNRILEKVMRDELVWQLADKYGIKISQEEIDDQIQEFEIRGGIEQSDTSLESVLSKYYDWDLNDLERVVKLQLAYQKLLPFVDDSANQRLAAIQAKLTDNADFAAVARELSEDENTKEGGGRIGTVDLNDHGLTAAAVDQIFSLEAGQLTGPIATAQGYYIYRIDKIIDADKRDVSQIFVAFFDIDSFLQERLDSLAHRAYITID